MVPPRPWKTDTLVQLAAGVVVCVLIGATLSGATHYDAAQARVAAHWFYLMVAGGGGALLAALLVVLREWTAENLISRAAVFLVLLFAGMNLAALATKLGGDTAAAKPRFLQILIATLALQGASLVLVAWFLRRNASSWSEAFGLAHAPRAALAKGIAVGIYSLPVLWIIQFRCADALRWLGWDPAEQTMIEVFRQMDNLPGKLYLGFAALVLAPVTEEILFRGLLYTALKQRLHRGLALGVASLVFAAMHANAASFLPLAVLAMGLALLYDHSENLLAPMAAHATFNTGNLVLLVAAQSFGLAPK